MFFDFHTHNPSIGEYGIYNYRIGKDKKIPDGVKYFTAGIHPWDVEDVSLDNAILELRNLLEDKKCVGLGEVGLDKVFGTNLELQFDVLRKQIELAKKSSKKVLIIHCVKAYQEILKEQKKWDVNLLWVLHGFNGSGELIRSLNNEGFYFSVGALLFKQNSRIRKTLVEIPLNKLFLESDESGFRIEELYLEASNLFKVGVGELQIWIKNNLKTMFPDLNG